MTSLLFVHLGTSLPSYLVSNLKRTRALFPDRNIVLIHSGQRGLGSLKGIVELFRYDPQELAALALDAPELDQDQGFWDGYWQHTFERLFALGAWQASNQERFIHVESDVILFPHFPFAAFDRMSLPAWPTVSATMDVASIVFSPNFDSYREVLVGLRQFALSNPKCTDMSALSQFAMANPSKFTRLPAHPDAVSEDPEAQHDFNSQEGQFPGIFDGLTLGHWFSGRDPRNSWGVRSRYIVPLDSPLMFDDFWFTSDGKGNLFATRVSGEKIGSSKPVPIYCLHVHSKALGYFESKGTKFLSLEVETVNQRSDRRRFFIRPFLKHLRTHALSLLRASASIAAWKTLMSRIMKRLDGRGVAK